MPNLFFICADEAADSSSQEELPLILRYVDDTTQSERKFVDFVLCNTGTIGVAIAEKLLAAMEEYGLNPEYLCGQAYDGAGNMASKCRGAAASILSNLYVHCAVHSLNLCVVAACGVQCLYET